MFDKGSTEIKFECGFSINEKSSSKTKKGGKEKKTKKHKDILDIHPFNVDIYDTSPETKGHLFIRVEGEFISRRLIQAPSYKIIHSSKNPISNNLLKEAIRAFTEGPVTYSDLMQIVDNSREPYTCYLAKRIWWMMKYNEFLRFCLVKRRMDKDGEEAYMLIQHWMDHPLISRVKSERERILGKKEA